MAEIEQLEVALQEFPGNLIVERLMSIMNFLQESSY